jgi:hypothetical protein
VALKKKSKRSKQVIEDEDEDEVDDDEVDEEDADEDDEEADEDNDEEDEDEDEEEEPVKKKKKTASVKKKSKPVDDDDEDDEEDDDEEESPKSSAKWFSHDVSKPTSGNTSGQRFKFEPDEEYEVVFLKDSGLSYSRHYVPSANEGRGGYFTCPNDGCPLCKAGSNKNSAAAFHASIADKNGKPTYAIIIEGTRFAKKFSKQKTKRGTLAGVVFGITKTGKGTETDWDWEFKEKRKLDAKEKAMLSSLTDFTKQFKPRPMEELKKVAKSINSDDD